MCVHVCNASVLCVCVCVFHFRIHGDIVVNLGVLSECGIYERFCSCSTAATHTVPPYQVYIAGVIG